MNHELEPWGRPAHGMRLPQQPPLWPADHFSQAALLRAQMQRYLHALRRRWWILLLSLLLIGGPAVMYAYLKPPTFKSQAFMWLTGGLNLSNPGGYDQDVGSYIGTQAQLLKSPIIQSRAFKRLQSHSAPLQERTKEATAPPESPFDLSVRSSQRSSVVELRATGPDPEATRAFLDAVMEEYQVFKKEQKRRDSTGASSSIAVQIAEVEEQLQQQQNRITLFEMSNNVSYWNEYRISAGTHLASLDRELSDRRSDLNLLGYLTPKDFQRLGPGANFGSRPEGSQTPNDVTIQAAIVQAMQNLQLLQVRYDQFNSDLRPTHSKMLKLKHEITGLEQLIKKLQQKDAEQALSEMESRKTSLKLQIANLESQRRSWETNAAEASHKLAEYDQMRQNLQRLQSRHDRLEGLMTTLALIQRDVDQERLLVPMEPASPGRVSLAKYGTAAAGLFLSVLVGMGAFMFLAFWDDRFTSARELSLQLPVEVLGQVPRAHLGDQNVARRLLSLENAAFTESFRNLRSAVFFMNGQQNQPRVVLVTSAIPKEGKSTVASNLARTLALSGSRVLLVDADLRRSSVHRLFKLRPGPGLMEALSQGLDPAQVIAPTDEPTLFVLPAGTEGNPSSDLFLGPAMEQLLRELRQQYHYIVIDTAPVLATDDAATLGQQADGVFLVVRAAYTSSHMAREALGRLQQRNVKILGTVYNGAAPSKDYYCQYGRDYYGSERTARRG